MTMEVLLVRLNRGSPFFLATAVRSSLLTFAQAGMLPSLLATHEPQPALSLEDVNIIRRGDIPLDTAMNATEAYSGYQQLSARPLLWSGKVLETIPGLIGTQYSSTGKSNQMFLRGFNLDYETDFTTHVDRVPINLPSHAHGQGYTESQLFPNLSRMFSFAFRPYYADEEGFSATGSAHISYFDALPDNPAVASGGSDDY